MMTQQRKLYPTKKKIGGGVELEVCARNDRFGKGPCFSIYERGTEMLRFDLFERGPHWHTYREHGSPRHYFDGPFGGPGASRDGMSKLFRDAVALAATKYSIAGEHQQWLLSELWRTWNAHAWLERT